MNRTIAKAWIDAQIKRDPLRNAAEYSSLWRDSNEAFLTREAVAAVTAAYQRGARIEGAKYTFFIDASGGRNDAFAGAAARVGKDGHVHVDFCHHIPAPFSPEKAVAEFAEHAKQYGCTAVYGDRYAADFAVEAFKRHGVTLLNTKAPASELMLSLGPRVNSGSVTLPENKRLFTELIGLQRRPGGITQRERVGHARGGHDDLANAVAGAVYHAALFRNRVRRRIGAALPEVFSTDTRSTGDRRGYAGTSDDGSFTIAGLFDRFTDFGANKPVPKSSDFDPGDFQNWPLALNETHAVEHLMRKGKTRSQALDFITDHRTKLKGTPA